MRLDFRFSFGGGGCWKSLAQHGMAEIELGKLAATSAASEDLELDRNHKIEAELNSEASNSKNADLRDFAQRTKALDDHLQVIKDIKRGVDSGKSSGGR